MFISFTSAWKYYSHCLRGDITVVIGSDNRSEGERINVSKSIQHPEYNENTDEFDMGILFLERPISFDDIEFPILNNDNAIPQVGETTHVMGWGDVIAGDAQQVSERLMITDLEVISNSECKSMTKQKDGQAVSYNDWIYDDMLCTFTEGQDACQGDSGGPLVVRGEVFENHPRHDTLVGIVR